MDGIVQNYYPDESKENEIKKAKRALVRFHLGASIGGQYLLVTLTTPENFNGGLNRAWRLFRLRMSRLGMNREYFAVREFNKKRTAEHLHVVFRTGALPVHVVREAWTQAVNTCVENVWTHHKFIWNLQQVATYLGKYLFKDYGMNKGLRKYWYSQGWIFSKAMEYSKRLYMCGIRMDVKLLRIMRKLGKDQRRGYVLKKCDDAVWMYLRGILRKDLTRKIKDDLLLTIGYLNKFMEKEKRYA